MMIIFIISKNIKTTNGNKINSIFDVIRFLVSQLIRINKNVEITNIQIETNGI